MGGGGGGILDILAPIAAAIATPFIGPEILPLSLAGETGALTAADALVGAALGAGSSALTGGDPLKGALTGGVGGAFAPNMSDIGSAIFGGSGDAASGAAGAAGTTGSAGGSAAGTTAAAGPVASTGTAPLAGASAGLPGSGVFMPTDMVQPINSALQGPVDQLNAALNPLGTYSPTPSIGSAVSPSLGASAAPGAATGGAPQASLGGPEIANTTFGSASAPYGATGFTAPSEQPYSIGSALGGGGASAAPAAAAKPSLSDRIVSYLGGDPSSTGGSIASKALGLAPTAGMMGMQLLQGQQKPAGYDELLGAASKEAAIGSSLISAYQSGTLPPALQQGLSSAAESAKAATRSRYASMGMSGSSAEAQDLASIDQRVAVQGAQLLENLLGQGLSETQASSGLYSNLLTYNTSQDKQLGDAMAGFASALAGGSGNRGVTVNLGSSGG